MSHRRTLLVFVTLVVVGAGAAVLLTWLNRADSSASRNSVSPGGIPARRPSSSGSLSGPLPSLPSTARGGRDLRTENVAVQTADGTNYLPEMVELSRRLNSPEGRAEEDIAVVQEIMQIYRRVSGGVMPGGAYNEEITSTLRGENSRRFSVLAPDLPVAVVSEGGELLDRWGTPYFLHPLSGECVEVRSAGGDQKMWTEDDVLSNPGSSEMQARQD